MNDLNNTAIQIAHITTNSNENITLIICATALIIGWIIGLYITK